jgi:coniferyl-aldehyde dehydrogenase
MGLAIGPLAAALAAGNRVMIKPSEYTPGTSRLMERLLAAPRTPESSLVSIVTEWALELFTCHPTAPGRTR